MESRPRSDYAGRMNPKSRARGGWIASNWLELVKTKEPMHLKFLCSVEFRI